MAAKKEKKKRSVFKRILRRTGKVLLIMFITSTIYVIACRWMMPPITITQLGNWVGGYGLKRDYVSWDEISANVKLAAIASEDQLFPEHGGFDWDAMDKSMEEKPKRKKKSKRIWGGGASTISQQTAKNVFLWQGTNIVSRYARKIPEFYFTKLIEWTWGKQRILEVYLNTIEMGPGIFGVEAASQKYFKKSAKNLTKEEAAMIIACLPNPKRFTVIPMSRWVAWKKNFILRQMYNISDNKKLMELIK